MALVVSGGHTSLLLLGDLGRDPIVHLGDTIDDAAGEAFDKVARVLGLGYPAGPSSTAWPARATRTPSPSPRAVPALGPGLRVLLLGGQDGRRRWVEARVDAGGEVPVADVAASFQEAVADVLTRKALAACREHRVDTLLLVGGVAANSRVRSWPRNVCAAAGVQLRVPPIRLCTDNGAMIAAVGDLLVRAGAPASGLDLGADPSAPLTGALLAGPWT